MKDWTKEEINILIENRKKRLFVKEISKILNRSKSAIYIKLSELKIKLYNKWTKKEIKLLIEKYSYVNTEEIKQLFPQHSFKSIIEKARQLGLKRKNKKCPIWTKEEIKKLKELAGLKYNNVKIAKILNRPIGAVKEQKRNYCRQYFIWDEKEINILKQFYKKYVIEELKKILPYKTRDQIQKKANGLKLYKPDSLLWSDEEVVLLKKEYSNKTTKELLSLFPGKTKKQINKKAQRLKIRKTEETYARCLNSEVGKIPILPGRKTKWRFDILKRDNYCCQECGLYDKTCSKLNAHHIVPVRIDIDNKYNINNGICLCKECHKLIHNKEEEKIEYYKKLIRRT